MFKDLILHLNYTYFFVSAVLFLLGIYFGPYVVDNNYNWLLVYPRWALRTMEKYFDQKRSFLLTFLVIFILNNLSIFVSVISGFLIVLPPLAAFLTGLNVSIVSYEMLGWKGIWHILVNPVAWLEFPAAWIGFSFGFSLAATQLTNLNFQITYNKFEVLLPLYLKYVVSILFIAAFLETTLIMFVERYKDNEDE
jgi:hypothetical protein